MAVRIDPGGEAGQSERLISSGGNVFSLTEERTKIGVATRGRGYWTGRRRHSSDDPDVDNPTAWGANAHEPMPDKNDGFEDDVDPQLAMRMGASMRHVTRAQLKQAKEIIEAAMGSPANKGLTRGVVKVDLLLQNPDNLTPEDLVKAASVVTFLFDTTRNDHEKSVLRDYADRLAAALRKALPQPRDPDKKDSKPVKHGAQKAQETKVNSKGKVAYKYPKKGDGKGPNSDRGGSEKKAKPPVTPAEQAANQDELAVTPPVPIDPRPFAKVIGVSTKELTAFAQQKTQQQFVDFFVRHAKLVKKHGVSAAFLTRLYDALTQSSSKLLAAAPAQPAPTQQSGPTPQSPAQYGKSPRRQADAFPASKAIVVFRGATLDGRLLALMNLLKSHRAETVEDVRKCLQAHFACTEHHSVDLTRTLLRKLEHGGLVTLYPPKEPARDKKA